MGKEIKGDFFNCYSENLRCSHLIMGGGKHPYCELMRYDIADIKKCDGPYLTVEKISTLPLKDVIYLIADKKAQITSKPQLPSNPFRTQIPSLSLEKLDEGLKNCLEIDKLTR